MRLDSPLSQMDMSRQHIETMRTTPVVGNAYDDRFLWDACHNVAADESLSMELRLESLARMNDITGEDDPVDENALREYLEYLGL